MNVNGKDDIPYIIKNKIHGPNHQPGTQQDVHWTLGTPFHLMVHHLTYCNGYVMGIPKFQTKQTLHLFTGYTPSKSQ